MDVATLALSALLLIAVLAIFGEVSRTREKPDLLREKAEGHDVIVNTTRPDDQVVRGVLLSVDERWLRVARAAYVAGPDDSSPMSGEVLVPRDRVAFVQVLDPAGQAIEVTGERGAEPG